MTRLKVADIKDIEKQLPQYDDELVRKTGTNLRGIACFAVGVGEEEIFHNIAAVPAAVVPITAGQGIITGFSTAVKAILEFIGFKVFVTKLADAAGTAEAFERGSRLIFMADDNRFVALNIKRCLVVDNAAATGKGFAAALELMSGGVAGERVLVLGCGPVGFSVVESIIRFGARVSVYDIVPGYSLALREKIEAQLKTRIKIEKDLKRVLSEVRLIVDATNAAGIIPEEVISPRTYIAAPGMPLGLTPAAVEKIAGRLLHDPLQLGVAAMAIEAIKL